MSIIIVKTERSFAAKDKELHELFKKSHAPHLKRLRKLENAVKKLQKQALSSQKMGKANLAKKMREIRKLDEMASVEREKGGRPRRYPEGALLILEKKCPYCLKLRVYNRRHFSPRVRAHVSLAPFPDSYMEVVRINPGICESCAYATAKKSDEASKPKGLWDTLFG